ncbi:MAG: hypothetical protein DCF31_05830 [Alphaproteobacteria bacterium]|nr:MAG: hypothetical protein DCF31_05830 [Alphaproteobacteria bacterium]
MGDRMKTLALLLATLALPAAAAEFSVSGASGDGRIIVIVSPKATPEPRMQVDLNAPLRSPYMFGATIDGVKAGTAVTVGADADGWPVKPGALPPRTYTVQAVLNRYETFKLANGKTVKLPPDMGEGQHWNVKPGNLYSKPQLVTIAADGAPVAIALTETVAPIVRKVDTEFVKHIRIKSELLSKFWGRPMYLGAHVLLPAGFATHPEARYPLMVNHGHYPDDIGGFRTTPPDPDLKPDYSERFKLAGYNRIEQQEAYDFYQKWISKDFPRFLVIEIEHANPYYDDSYAVNSANLGPYGDAINTELIPEIEKRFRGLGQGWARFTYGGSTGGWEAMATQIFYPDMYNGAFVACPDPIDFKAYTTVNLYEDKNAYAKPGLVTDLERAGLRNYLGENLGTIRGGNQMEAVLGDHGRSGEQWDIWQAVFSPMGADGYPAPIWDKATGAIDPKVAEYWRQNYDLTDIVVRDWSTLGPKIAGKINIYVGSADNYMLNNAVYSAQERLGALKNPEWGGEFAYGERAEHCWNGDPTQPNAIARLRYNSMYLPKIMARIAATAPEGADLTSWRY